MAIVCLCLIKIFFLFFIQFKPVHCFFLLFCCSNGWTILTQTKQNTQHSGRVKVNLFQMRLFAFIIILMMMINIDWCYFYLLSQFNLILSLDRSIDWSNWSIHNQSNQTTTIPYYSWLANVIFIWHYLYVLIWFIFFVKNHITTRKR